MTTRTSIAPPQRNRITQFQFLSALTPEERLAHITFRDAAIQAPAASRSQLQVQYIDFVELFAQAQDIDMDAPETRAGLTLMVAVNVLTQARADFLIENGIG